MKSVNNQRADDRGGSGDAGNVRDLSRLFFVCVCVCMRLHRDPGVTLDFGPRAQAEKRQLIVRPVSQRSFPPTMSFLPSGAQ